MNYERFRWYRWKRHNLFLTEKALKESERKIQIIQHRIGKRLQRERNLKLKELGI